MQGATVTRLPRRPRLLLTFILLFPLALSTYVPIVPLGLVRLFYGSAG